MCGFHSSSWNLSAENRGGDWFWRTHSLPVRARCWTQSEPQCLHRICLSLRVSGEIWKIADQRESLLQFVWSGKTHLSDSYWVTSHPAQTCSLSLDVLVQQDLFFLERTDDQKRKDSSKAQREWRVSYLHILWLYVTHTDLGALFSMVQNEIHQNQSIRESQLGVVAPACNTSTQGSWCKITSSSPNWVI